MIKLIILVSLSIFSFSLAATTYECLPNSEPAYYNDCFQKITFEFSSNFEEVIFSAPECAIPIKNKSVRHLSYAPTSKVRKNAYKYKSIDFGDGCELDAIVLNSIVSKKNKAYLILESHGECGYDAFKYYCERN